MKLTGTNPDFHATWDCNKQHYDVFKGERFIIRLYGYAMVKNYIN